MSRKTNITINGDNITMGNIYSNITMDVFKEVYDKVESTITPDFILTPENRTIHNGLIFKRINYNPTFDVLGKQLYIPKLDSLVDWLDNDSQDVPVLEKKYLDITIPLYSLCRLLIKFNRTIFSSLQFNTFAEWIYLNMDNYLFSEVLRKDVIPYKLEDVLGITYDSDEVNIKNKKINPMLLNKGMELYTRLLESNDTTGDFNKLSKDNKSALIGYLKIIVADCLLFFIDTFFKSGVYIKKCQYCGEYDTTFTVDADYDLCSECNVHKRNHYSWIVDNSKGFFTFTKKINED